MSTLIAYDLSFGGPLSWVFLCSLIRLRLVLAGSNDLGLGILCIAGERAKAVFTTCFLDSGLGDLLGHGRGTTLGRGCRLGLHSFRASVLSILSLVSVETLHVVVELLLAGLLEPDRLLSLTESLPLVSDQLGEVG